MFPCPPSRRPSLLSDIQEGMWAPKRFKNRLILFTLGSIAIVFLSLTLFSFHRERVLLEQGLRNKLRHIAATAAQAISAEEHAKIDNSRAPSFTRIRNFLRKVKKSNELQTEIYTLVPDPKNPKVSRFVVMTNKEPFFGAPYPATKEFRLALATGKPQTSAPYKDQNGTWISAYAPIVGRNGKPLAVLEVDQREAFLTHLVHKKAWKAFLLGSLFLGIILILALGFSRSLTRPIQELSRRIRRIQMGKPIPAPSDCKILEFQEVQQGLTTLAQVVEDREVLVQEKLQTLEETDRLRSSLITLVSHELKTPLTGIVASAEFLATIELNDEERLEFTQDLLLQSHSFAKILDRLIQFSALQAKPLPHQIVDLSLHQEVQESLDLLAKENSLHEIPVKTMGLKGLWIQGEKTRVQRALIEILKNSLEHSSQNQEIQIEAHQNGQWVELRIRDRGKGISAEAQEIAWTPLGQDGDVLVGKKDGLGMGLPLAKLSLEGIQASLEIESTGPNGTTILIRFPAGTALLDAPSIRTGKEKNRAI